MNYVSGLLFTLIIPFCQSNKTGIETNSNSKEDLTERTELSKPIKISAKKDYSTKLSLGKDGIVTDGGISITSEIIYDEAFGHNIFNDLLKKHVSTKGHVNYAGFQKDKEKLSTYINHLSKNLPTEEWSKPEKLAYWINAYNALTIDLMLKHPKIKSIKDIKNPWDQRLWKLGDKWYNLTEIEHDILRQMEEPRIHFTIVCASVSCPKLQNEAFTASNLEEQLTKATKEFLTDPSKNELSQDEIKLSKIFKWFSKDFEQKGSLIAFLNTYSTIEISESAKKSFKDWDWDLND